MTEWLGLGFWVSNERNNKFPTEKQEKEFFVSQGAFDLCLETVCVEKGIGEGNFLLQ